MPACHTRCIFPSALFYPATFIHSQFFGTIVAVGGRCFVSRHFDNLMYRGRNYSVFFRSQAKSYRNTWAFPWRRPFRSITCSRCISTTRRRNDPGPSTRPASACTTRTDCESTTRGSSRRASPSPASTSCRRNNRSTRAPATAAPTARRR